MTATLDPCPRNDGGYLYPIGETAGGILLKCFVCESQMSQPKPKGADAQFAASQVDPAKQTQRTPTQDQTRVLEAPTGKKDSATK